MVIHPKVRGFICTTTHPVGCDRNVLEQIEATRARGVESDGPRKVLVIGASSGYGLAARVTAAFGYGADTLGVFFEKPGTEKRPGTAGWYNSAAFDKYAKQAGLYSRSINGDAFSHEVRDQAVEMIRNEMGGQVDLVVYSLASPVRKLPDSGEVKRSALKPIGETYRATAVDTNRDQIIEAEVEPATQEEIDSTVTVMGGEDWELWIDALDQAGVLAEGAKSVAFSYIGTEITWPIYWHGALGKAKEDLDRAAGEIDQRLRQKGGHANVAVLKSVVTQASAAIPVMPLYISMVYRIMKEQGLHEGTIDQLNRLYRERLYTSAPVDTDEAGRLRVDDRELREDVQQACQDLWPRVTSDNLFELTDYAEYKREFLKLFGFGRDDVDYDADVDPRVEFDVVDMT
ncbi:enoyl-ACP reductase FabV [Kushneria phosphatilytica]|uniref:Enoyl-[acyl-carrier-protein] reductase [NADH] n=1 Tax=Kushneria phosphatilytica TaxID=657387 RepID=A0A1S1NSB3_9GAMM|nr:enoyl-ACP reductase FabV [Kushneria phosphatilytica]OHV07810.1 trans-2-enoyl-CoA reductase [Kushneria phosphatilytica]QEL10318.1 trans-2-enoyl-CoA reductase family protein [Kushneria phosphatilytica]